MKMAWCIILTAVFIFLIIVGSAGGAGKSEAQEWPFKLEKVWEITKIGDNQLLRPAEPRVADDGTLYFRDFERKQSYIIDSAGKLITAFAAQGDNPGDVPFYINCFPAGDYAAVCAPDKIYFYSSKGQFVKAAANNLFVRFPLAFKNENEFWVAPGALGDAPGGIAALTHVNLQSGKESVIREFALSDEEKRPSQGVVIVGLTPQLKLGLDRATGSIYFGKNSDSKVYRLNGDAGTIDSFSFTGTRQPISEEDKKNHFARSKVPAEQAALMIAALPNQMTYYNRLQVVNGLIYLFSSDNFGGEQTGQIINIYSPEGRHLYYGRVAVENGWHIFSNPDNLQLSDGYIYAVLENGSGDKKLVKYKLALP
ncbi:exported hypothetical protein [Candidatus Zixiibacteriota bacterium]|nr:exported hypothetical protein [candidate division Zixibacteria bacterium]